MKKITNFNVSMGEHVEGNSNEELKASGKIMIGSNGRTEEEKKFDSLSEKKGFKQVKMLNDAAHIKREKEIKEYNNKVEYLEMLYSGLEPLNHRVIVRCFHMEATRSDGGLILMPSLKISIPTQNGMGQLMEIDSDYLYSKRAVIVAVPKRYETTEDSIKVGNIVQLTSSPLKVMSKGKDSKINMPYSFTHYTWTDSLPPKDIKSKHYGYLLVPLSELNVIVPKLN